MRRIIIFGIGVFFNARKNLLLSDQVVAFIDNSVAVDDNQKLYGKDLYNPEQIKHLNFEFVVLTSLKATEMKQQLLSLGVSEKKILYYEEYINMEYAGKIHVYNAYRTKIKNRKIAFMVPSLNNTGSSVAMRNAAKVLSSDYDVDIATSQADDIVIRNLIKNSIGVMIIPSIYTIKYDQCQYLHNYDLFICNTVYMLYLYTELSRFKRTILWIHDPYLCSKYSLQCMRKKNRKIDNFNGIYAVSNVARKAFYSAVGCECNIGLLSYGIPDKRQNHSLGSKIVFAILGTVYNGKGQDIFIDAALNLSPDITDKCEFWIIGEYAERSSYYLNIQDSISKHSNIFFKGAMEKKAVEQLYAQIDVVVSASRSDMLPTVIAEGMMNQLVVVTSDATGMADYIEDGYNGFVFQSENVRMLTEKMEYIVQNFSQLDHVKENARKTYEKFFTNSQFKKNLEDIINSQW